MISKSAKPKTPKRQKIPLAPQFKTSGDFYAAIIAQDDDNDYSESGYVIVQQGKVFALAKYSHCSCYGTWDALTGGDYSGPGNGSIIWEWVGTKRQLLALARKKGDPNLPGRIADPADYDYDHLMAVYRGVLDYETVKQFGGAR